MNQLVPVNAQPNFTASDVERVALAIAKGGLFGSKDPNAILTLCFLAQAEGQHPAVVFRDYHIIQGKPAKKAEAMLRDFINSGGKVEWHTLTDDCADATFTHPAGSARIEWTMERAKKAGISTAMWSKYPRQMLRSRVISEGVRTVYPGATSGLYVPEEVQAFEPTSGSEVIEATSGPAPRTKLDGPYTSKTALKNAIHGIATAIRDADSVEAVNAALKGGKEAITQAERDWPELLEGDPALEGDDEGLKRLAARRRLELSEPEESVRYQLIISGINECTSANELRAWFRDHGDQIGLLDGEESRLAEAAYEDKAAALRQLDEVTAGA